jgi:hypothetical protein
LLVPGDFGRFAGSIDLKPWTVEFDASTSIEPVPAG